MTFWAIFGTLAIPSLVAIYFFRNRYPKKVVSSLLLWGFPEVRMRMGNKKKNFIAERSFWLELITILLFLFILYEILVPAFQTQSRTIFVLDSRYSLLAKTENNKTVREIIIDEIVESSGNQNYVSIIVADQIPELLVVNSNDKNEIEKALINYQPNSMNFDWQMTKVMLLELADVNTKTVIYSDRNLADTTSLVNCELRLRGKASNNYAFISGTYSENVGKGKLQLLAKALLINNEKPFDLLKAEIKIADQIISIEAQIDNKGYYNFQVDLPSCDKAVDVRLVVDDPLLEDNFLHFEPPPIRKLNVGINISDPNTFTLISNTLRVFNNVKVQNQNCHLMITDTLDKSSKVPQILIGIPSQISSEAEKDVFGELIIQKGHPLLRDVYPQNVRWRGCKKINEIYEAYLYQGEIPLIGRLVNFQNDVFFLNMNINKSDFRNLQEWPIFWDNIQQHFLKNVDGIKYTTVLGGVDNYFNTPLEEIEVHSPRNRVLKLNSVNCVVDLPPFTLRGSYQIKDKDKLIEKFYVNFFDVYSMNLSLNENTTKVISENKNNEIRKLKQSGNNHFFVMIILLLAIALYCFNLFLDFKEGVES